MWNAPTMGENSNEKHMDLCATKEAVPIIDRPSGTAIATTPAIAHMIMTPKTRATENPAANPGYTGNPTPKKDPQLAHLQRDLNSPSAALRIRAMRALKSPHIAYNNFDVPHAETSIITAEERNPCPPPTLSEILQDVIVYVEVRTGSDNRSEGVKTIISKLGAQVNDRLLRNTTHVIFKDGLLSTYKRAQSWNIPIVSILWIEACKVQQRLCEPKLFPISNIHMYEFPELYGKMSRVRYMQPDSELNKRPRKRQGTPTGQKDKEATKKSSTPTTPAQNSISRYFMPLSQTKKVADGDDGIMDSPATKLLNRITNGCFTPLNIHTQSKADIQAVQTDEADTNGVGDVPNNKPTSDKRKQRSCSLTVEPTSVFTPVRNTRRRSSMFDSPSVGSAGDKVQSEPRLTRRRSLLNVSQKARIEDNTPETPAQPEERMTRRRSSLLAAASIIEKIPDPPQQQEPHINRRSSNTNISTMEPSTPKLLKKPSFQAIAEEPLLEPSTSSSEHHMQPVMCFTPHAPSHTPMHHKTNYVQESMEISVSRAVIIGKATGRRTLYATARMDISEPNDENVNPYLGECSYTNVTTQTSMRSVDEQSPVPVFSSTRLPGSNTSSNRRRSLFNVDMELINERINNINNTSQRRSLALANEAELGESRAVAPLQAVTLNVTEDKTQISTEPKKRRLYTPNEEIVLSSPSTSSSSRSNRNSASTGTVKRRRTLASLKPTAAVGPTLQNDFDSNNENDIGKEKFVTPFDSDATNDSASESHGDGVRQAAKRRTLHTLVHTNMHRDQVQVIHKAIRKLHGMRLDPTVTKRTTHLVSLEPRRTLNMLRGLMRGVWIVSYKWVLESMRAGKWVNEEKYELTSFSRSVEICRTERQAFGISYRCELFRYMETFYVSSLCRPITFNNIKELLLLGGAKLTENRYKAKFIVGDKRRAEDDRIYLSPLWVLDSITSMQIQKFGKYLMKCAIVTPYGIRYEDPCQEEKPRRNLKVCYKDPSLVINK